MIRRRSKLGRMLSPRLLNCLFFSEFLTILRPLSIPWSKMLSKREEIDLEEMKYKYYIDLRDETCRIRRSGKYFHSPYCEDQRRREYKLGELIQHASRVGNESKSASLRTKA